MSYDALGTFWFVVLAVIYLAVAGVVIYIAYLLIRALRKYLRS